MNVVNFLCSEGKTCPYKINKFSLIGNITEAERDSRDNIKSIRKLDNQGNLLTQTSYNYSDMRELVSVTDAKGNAITSEYDMLGRRLALESADWTIFKKVDKTYGYKSQGV